MINIKINNREYSVVDGMTVAAAMIENEIFGFRFSVAGEPRGPLCGMGICFECRVSIDGIPHQRSCCIIAAEGMEVVTSE